VMGGARVGTRAVRGPLAPWAAGYESWLAARGYASRSVYQRACLLSSLSCWLERERLLAGDLNDERAERFLDARRSAGRSRWVSSRCLALPLAYLREVGAVPESVPAIAGDAVDELLERYREYLLLERGLASRTIVEYRRTARLFLEQRPVGLELERLTAADVSGFLVRECPRRTVAGARHLVSDLRPLLRYLHVAGLIETQLVWAVPGVADLRDRSLPRGLEPKVVARLLASCDRRRTVGRRDYAIVLLLVWLGLRAAEVAAIELEDVDWRRGEILVCGKRNRHDVLPLPVDVGEALVSYLQRRGPDQSRAVFLRVTAPAGPLSNDAVRGVVHDACVRAGVPPVGAHRLRHTAATGMLREGASLPEIAQVLRHREIKTTSIYAKVDRARLRALAKPWPGAQS
jgi:integrase/recombinase XerD